MNTQNENNTNAQNPSVPSMLPGVTPSRGRPLSRLLCLSERQLEHVNAWLKEGVPYREIVNLCREHFQKEIPRMTFFRYANRRELARELQLDEIVDAREAAAEFSKYALTGDPSFSTNTLALLEEQAFDLALAHQRDGEAEDLSTLKQLWDLIHKARSTNIRERHATVQERKCDLRAREVDLKALRLGRNLNLSGSSSDAHGQPCPTSTSRDAANQSAAAGADQNPSPDSAETKNSNPNTDNSPASEGAKRPYICVSPNPLPPEIVEENRRYAEKLRTGKIIFDESGPYIRDIELPDEVDNNTVAPAAADASLSQQGQQGRGLGEGFTITAARRAVSTHNTVFPGLPSTASSHAQPSASSATPNP